MASKKQTRRHRDLVLLEGPQQAGIEFCGWTGGSPQERSGYHLCRDMAPRDRQRLPIYEETLKLTRDKSNNLTPN